jgi:Dolichyl-phosphate-mannose-protein mannosyltransferase
MSAPLRERAAVRSASPPRLTVVPRPRRLPGAKAALVAVYAVAVLYHWLNSRGHVSPIVFGDEILYSKLAQSLVAGDGFAIRGEPVFFPAPLSILAQAPAWLFDSVPTAFAVIKTVNAMLMSAAVFPAYALARRFTRPSYALISAAAAVVGPPMLYHAYLMSEALAYPVFFLACLTMVRALEQPSRRMELAVVAISCVACLTRIQFVVLPVAYLLAVPAARGLAGLRRHLVSLAGIALLLSIPLLTSGLAMGTYGNPIALDFAAFDVLHWGSHTATTLAFAAAWLVVPGALFGLALMLRQRSSAAILCTLVIAGVLLEAAMIAASQADRVVERYVIYAVPLLFIAFFGYVELGAPHRRLYAATAIVLGAAAVLYPFPVRAGTLFSFDTPTFSVYGQLATWWGHANAATIFAGVPLLGSVALAALGLRRSWAAAAVGVATLCLLFLSGIPAYAGDRNVSRGTLEVRAGSPPDWLDRSGLGPADYLQLPGGSAHYGWVLEVWNRNFRKPVHLSTGGDWWSSSTARVTDDGRLLVDGRPARGPLVVNDFGTAIDLDGNVVGRPRNGLTAYRLAPRPRVRLIADGLMFDRWAAGVVKARAWPRRPGVFRVTLSLPAGRVGRTVTLTTGRSTRRLDVAPGETKTVALAGPPHLRIDTSATNVIDAGTADARLVGVRIPALSFRPKP